MDSHLALVDRMRSREGIKPNFDLEELSAAFKACKSKDKIDNDGISLSALEFLYLAKPHELSDLSSSLASSTSSMKRLSVDAAPFGKESSFPCNSSVRLILLLIPY